MADPTPRPQHSGALPVVSLGIAYEPYEPSALVPLPPDPTDEQLTYYAWHANWCAVLRHLPGLAFILDLTLEHVLEEPDNCPLCQEQKARRLAELREMPA